MRARHLLPGLLVVAAAGGLWVLTGGGVGASAAGGVPRAPAASAEEQRGHELFLTGCSSCHGVAGQGLRVQGEVRGPSLQDSGAAAAYYQLTTGRMPLAASDDLPKRKPPAYGPADIRALVAYVASLGHGPAVPDVQTAQGDLAVGGELFRANCQACHSATGAGGALSYGRAAPSLSRATPTQVGAAMRSGPGQMPVFSPKTLSAHDVDSIARYVRYLEHPDDRGGLALGRLGPIPEGLLIWVLGIGSLLIACVWIGGRNPDRNEVPEP